MDSSVLAYYRSHSPITDPGEFAHLYDNLPDGLHELIGTQSTFDNRMKKPENDQTDK